MANKYEYISFELQSHLTAVNEALISSVLNSKQIHHNGME